MPFSVMVVDDLQVVVSALDMLIEMDDRLILSGTASDGVEAIDAVVIECPDAIICDVEMPRMDGIEALPILRRTCPQP